MSTIEKTATKSALEQIEKEIRQIDQLVNSWSDGRSLRFDPAHVQSPAQDPPEPAKPQPTELKPGKTVFFFNLIAFCFPIAFILVQSTTAAVNPQLATLVLGSAIMFVAGSNLFLAAFGVAKSLEKSQADRPTKRNLAQKTKTRS